MLCGLAVSIAEGVRFDTLFRWHLEAEVSTSFVIAICFVRWFMCVFMYCSYLGSGCVG
jgi:hypothetical protein